MARWCPPALISSGNGWNILLQRMENHLSHDRSSHTASPQGDDHGSDPFEVMRQIGSASADVWSAWTDAWTGVLANRGAPVGEVMLKAIADPTAWPTALVPILDEIRAAISLPTFADLPGVELFQLPSPAPLVGLNWTLLVGPRVVGFKV